jgi:hypothetical protein
VSDDVGRRSAKHRAITKWSIWLLRPLVPIFVAAAVVGVILGAPPVTGSPPTGAISPAAPLYALDSTSRPDTTTFATSPVTVSASGAPAVTPSPGRAGAGPPNGSYEAESATLGPQTATRAVPGASGGLVVAFVGHGPNGSLTFTGISVSSGGTHTLTIWYSTASSCSLTMHGNGGPATDITFAPTGGANTISTFAVTIVLKPGANSIEFDNPAANGPDLDRVRIS